VFLFSGIESTDTAVSAVVSAVLMSETELLLQIIDEMDVDDLRRAVFTLSVSYSTLFEREALTHDGEPLAEWQELLLVANNLTSDDDG
jgi:hypothetical protein